MIITLFCFRINYSWEVLRNLVCYRHYTSDYLEFLRFMKLCFMVENLVVVVFSYYRKVFALNVVGVIPDELWALNFLFNLYDFFFICLFTCCYLIIYIRRCSNLCLTVMDINLIFMHGFMPSFGMALRKRNCFIIGIKLGYFCWNKWYLTTLFI